MDFIELINDGIGKKASDIHITVGLPAVYRINGELVKAGNSVLTPEDTEKMAMSVLNDRQKEVLKEKGEIDISFSIHGVGRYRINIFRQRGSHCMAIRVIPLNIPSMEELGLPMIVNDLTELRNGLILVTGPTGSGKSTTLAYMIDRINSEKRCHILTLEDPIEYLHRHKKSIVNQREMGSDSMSYANGLRAALRQDPDVILIGEMRDLETIGIALTAAETGHLVLSTLHTVDAANTVDRVIDVFPSDQQRQIRVQFASVIQATISQQLLPRADGNGQVCAFEIMMATEAVRNLIREGKTHQLSTVIQTGGKYGMQTLDSSMMNLYRRNLISRDTLMTRSMNPDMIRL